MPRREIYHKVEEVEKVNVFLLFNLFDFFFLIDRAAVYLAVKKFRFGRRH
jgi:hypothetical protein